VELERHFRGEFVTMWKIPAGYREKISIGDTGGDVDWVNAQLAALNGLRPPATGQAFDAAASLQSREFQSAQGLIADGVVGPMTFMQLNRAAGVSEPHVYRNATAEPPLARK
jgi:general secretion pathway protein A